MKAFDFYEFTGVLVPGVITLYGLSRLFPGTTQFLADTKLSLGDLGLFVILAYAGGHVVQALGNIFESVFWSFQGGMPSDWVRDPKRTLLSMEQTAVLQQRISAMFANTEPKSLGDREKKEWFGITRQVYAAVQAAGLVQRIDTFNGNYGMFRGITVGLLLCLGLLPFSKFAGWSVAGLCFGLALLSALRMRRFGVHYARELFVQFLQLSKEEK